MKKINREFWLDEIKDYVINDMRENEESIDEYLGCLQILHINEWDVDEVPSKYSWHNMRHLDIVEYTFLHDYSEFSN